MAFVFGLCLTHTLIKHFDGLYSTLMIFSGASLIFVLLWTCRVVRRITPAQHATSEVARKSARQFLWSCVYFALISSSFGVAVSSVIWHGSDFIRTFGVVFWAIITCVAIYPVRRDAKHLAAVGPSQVASE